MFILCTYGDDYREDVRVGDTLRMLARFPDSDTWSGTVSILTALGQSATNTQALSSYEGNRVQNRQWDLSADYDTSSLAQNTTYLAVLQLTNGSKTREFVRGFRMLPQGVT